MGKHSKVSCSTQCRVGENFFLRPMECLNPSVKFDIFYNCFTFVRMSTTLDLTTFYQQTFSEMQLHYDWAAKKGNMTTLNSVHQPKIQCIADSSQLVRTTTGWFTQLFLNLVNLRDFLGVGTKLKESIFKNNNKSIPMLQPEHGFRQQYRPECGQLQHWYQDEKMVVVRVCLNGRCCSSGCVDIALC